MRVRRSDERTSLTDRERLLLRDLWSRVPASADEHHPAVVDVLRFLESLNLPWWAPGGAMVMYLTAFGYVDRAGEEIDRLIRCTDWGEQPTAERPFRLPAFEVQT